MWGAMAPDPSTSQALSAPAAITGSPAGRPRCAAAVAVSSPSRSPVATRSGSMSRSTAIAFHFQSLARAQRRRLKSNGR